ncbi:17015_t:CDS:2, partial [Funneliformis caledonium]
YYPKKDTSLYFKINSPEIAHFLVLGQDLLGKRYSHPYRKDSQGYVVKANEFIQEEEGTSIVHLAPAFGAEDFAIAKKEKMTIDCPVEPNGLFNEKIAISELIGQHYSEP